MKRFMTIVSALSILAFASSAFAQNQYGWTVSGSGTDANVHQGSPTGGLATIYVWYACNSEDGITAAEFGLSTAPIAPLAPMNGFLNAGTANDQLQLVIGGCPDGPLLAGSLLYIDAVGIDVCLVPSVNNFNLTVDCLTGGGFDNQFIGYSSTGGPGCNEGADLCPPISVQDQTWGGVKGLYR